MQYRNVGGSGLKVSEIALGSWMTRLEDAAVVDIAMDIAHKAFDAGVNFFDCADAYSGGDAEVFPWQVHQRSASRRRGDFIEGVFQNRQFGQWRWSESQTYSQ